MKKEDLIQLGLDEETAKKVASASADELKGYIPKVRFDEVNNEKKSLELALENRDKQLDDLKKSTGDVESLKQQIETLQADNKAKDEAHQAEVRQLRLDSAIDTMLTNAKALNKTAVKALLKDLDKMEIEEDGTVRGLEEQVKLLQTADDSKFLFGSTKQQLKGAEPGESGVEEPDKKVDFSKMSYEELCAYMEANPDAKIE